MAPVEIDVMHKSIRRLIIAIIGLMFVSQGFWVIRGIANAFLDVHRRFTIASQDVSYVAVKHDSIKLMVSNSLIASIGQENGIDSVGMPDVDMDDDGLAVIDEALRLTSDLASDTDRDGIPDVNDPSPNTSHKHTSIESDLVTVIIERHSDGNTNYHESSDRGDYAGTIVAQIKMDDDGCFYGSKIDCTVVCASELEYIFLKQMGVKRVYRLKKMMHCPGFFYLVFSWYQCGSRCGEGKYYLVWDIPFRGPLVIAVFGHYQA